MSCLSGWDYGIAFDDSVLSLIKSTLALRLARSNANIINTSYNGLPVCIKFETAPKKMTLGISTTQTSALDTAISFSGNVNEDDIKFEGSATLTLKLSDIRITQTLVAGGAGTDSTPEWQSYVYLSEGAFESLEVTLDEFISSTYSEDAVLEVLTTEFQNKLDATIADSPISLGTHTSFVKSDFMGPDAQQAMGATLVAFDTLNLSSTPLLAAVAMTQNKDQPSGNWQSALEADGTFPGGQNANTTFAIADDFLWNMVAQYGASITQNGNFSMDYGVSGDDPSTLKINLTPQSDSGAIGAMKNFDWSFNAKFSFTNDVLQIIFNVKGAYNASYEFKLGLTLTQNDDGTQSIQATFSQGDSIISFDPSATGPTAVIASISALLYELQFPLAILEILGAIIWYSCLYVIVGKLPDKFMDRVSSRIGNDPKVVDSSYFSMESITMTNGIVIGIQVTSLPSVDDEDEA